MDPRTNDRIFRAFGDGRRLRILALLRRGEMCAGDVVAVLGLPQSTVSRQLGILREAGLVACREDSLWRHYSLAEPRSPLHARLVGCLADCFADLPDLERDARTAERLAAHGGCCPPGCGPSCRPASAAHRKPGLPVVTPREKGRPRARRARPGGSRTSGVAGRGRRSRGR